jgi:hypothetical protein
VCAFAGLVLKNCYSFNQTIKKFTGSHLSNTFMNKSDTHLLSKLKTNYNCVIFDQYIYHCADECTGSGWNSKPDMDRFFFSVCKKDLSSLASETLATAIKDKLKFHLKISKYDGIALE